ncbi:MAG: AmmeMemoRadiSam system protein A [Clostridia bacterium]|nr:AmmeMemoRadiSam system protein A [Clostridia bacterium]
MPIRYLGGEKLKTSYQVKLASESLSTYLLEGEIMPIPENVPEDLTRPAGAFVTLKKGGGLRGCIGTIMPTKETAAEEIIMNAISAGTKDPRFPPVEPKELGDITISVDVLGEAKPIKELTELDPKRFGIIVRKGARMGVLLPDLEGVDSVNEQINIAKQKAGISPFENCEIEKFEVIRYV